jgi:hypothetical protein
MLSITNLPFLSPAQLLLNITALTTSPRLTTQSIASLSVNRCHNPSIHPPTLPLSAARHPLKTPASTISNLPLDTHTETKHNDTDTNNALLQTPLHLPLVQQHPATTHPPPPLAHRETSLLVLAFPSFNTPHPSYARLLALEFVSSFRKYHLGSCFRELTWLESKTERWRQRYGGRGRRGRRRGRRREGERGKGLECHHDPARVWDYVHPCPKFWIVVRSYRSLLPIYLFYDSISSKLVVSTPAYNVLAYVRFTLTQHTIRKGTRKQPKCTRRGDQWCCQ